MPGLVRPVTDERDGFVARQLLEAGHAHPVADGHSSTPVTAVVPVRDRPAALARCLDALTVPVVVVDDGVLTFFGNRLRKFPKK